MGLRAASNAIDPLTRFVHPHVVALLAVEPHESTLQLTTAYTGSFDGLLPLARLLNLQSSGQISPRQAMLVGVHLLSALDAGFRKGLVHGPLTIEEVLVDRHGRALIELFGVEAAVRVPDFQFAARESVRGVARIVYELICGLAPAENRVSASRLVRSVPRGLDQFFARAIDDDGSFEIPAQALEAISGLLR